MYNNFIYQKQIFHRWMLNYDLYINLTSNYTDDSDYFAVDVENTIELGEEMIDKMPIYRKSWNEITVKKQAISV